jgi:hypothetical protein
MSTTLIRPQLAYGLAALAIVVGTFAGVALVLGFGIDGVDGGWFRFMFPLILTFISVVAIVQVRLIILPRLLSPETVANAPSFTEAHNTPVLMSAAFAGSNGAYAIFAAVWSGSPLAPIPFAILGFVHLAVYAPYVTERLREVEMTMKVEGAL